ncbi:MAG: DUF1264 domain-containing protein [Deinococcus sp.]|nr:DUF1264 domain-containing protein [Deinococcus sp.]
MLLVFLIPTLLGRGTAQEGARPHDGWTLHIDAKKHFPGNAEMIAHHYCKGVAGGLTECQLYTSDDPDARLVGVEVIVGPQLYNSFNAAEKALWHYHRTEIPKVEATLPDLSADEAARVVSSIEETYGKVYLLWDPGRNSQPVGNPSVTILDGPATRASSAVTLSTPVLVIVGLALLVIGWFLGRQRGQPAKK